MLLTEHVRPLRRPLPQPSNSACWALLHADCVATLCFPLPSSFSPLPTPSNPHPPAAAPKYESLGERLSDIANTVLGTMGLSQGVTDNASVNVIPLQASLQRGCTAVVHAMVKMAGDAGLGGGDGSPQTLQSMPLMCSQRGCPPLWASWQPWGSSSSSQKSATKIRDQLDFSAHLLLLPARCRTAPRWP